MARYVVEVSPLMNLFPIEVAGWQQILLRYIEDHCESFSFKVCDAFRDKWLHNDVERGLHRRHKERKFGTGCLEEWTRNVDALIGGFHRAIQPFELVLAKQPFLTEAAMCKIFSSEVAERTASLAINLFGGNGFVKEYPVEKLYRDAKIGRIYEGTTNIQKLTIAKQILA